MNSRSNSAGWMGRLTIIRASGQPLEVHETSAQAIINSLYKGSFKRAVFSLGQANPLTFDTVESTRSFLQRLRSGSPRYHVTIEREPEKNARR